MWVILEFNQIGASVVFVLFMIATSDIKHSSNDGHCFKLLALEDTLQRQVKQIIAVWVLFPFENGKIWFDGGWVGEQRCETATKRPQSRESNTQSLPRIVKLRLVVMLIENRLDGGLVLVRLDEIAMLLFNLVDGVFVPVCFDQVHIARL